jgi:hypothetical protein
MWPVVCVGVVCVFVRRFFSRSTERSLTNMASFNVSRGGDKTHYVTLQLDQGDIENLDEQGPSASSAADLQIRDMYVELALKYHPDRPTGAKEKFQQVCEAYNELKTRDSRINYKNQLGAQNRRPSSNGATPSSSSLTVFRGTFETSLALFKTEKSAYDADKIFERKFGEFISQNGGEIRAGGEYIGFINSDPTFKETFRRLGNPKAFCQQRKYLGFDYRDGLAGDTKGAYFTYNPAIRSSFEISVATKLSHHKQTAAAAAVEEDDDGEPDEMSLYWLSLIVKHLKQQRGCRDTSVNIGKACPKPPGKKFESKLRPLFGPLLQ